MPPANQPPVAKPPRPTKRPPRALMIGAIIAALVVFILPMLVGFITDWQWFSSIGFNGVFTKQLWLRIALFVGFFVVAAAIIGASGAFAFRHRPRLISDLDEQSPLAAYRRAIEQSLKKMLIGVPLVIGVGAGLVGQQWWPTFALAFHGQSFGVSDPQFGKDYGFYAFTLPLINVIVYAWLALMVVAFLVALAANYLLGGIRAGSIGVGAKGTMTKAARGQLAVIAGLWMVGQVLSFWLDRYDLLSKEHVLTQGQGSFTGGNYTDIHAVLPAKILLMVIAMVVAVAFFSAVVLKDLRIPALATVLMVISSVIIGVAWPMAVEKFQVIPNRAAKESEYIGRNIEATKFAYGLTDDKVTYERDWGAQGASNDKVAADAATLSNIRLLDPQILAPTFTQREQLKNFYGFPKKLNIDRYTVDGQLRDYVVAAREIDPRALTDNQKGWINRHTVYTHGNGLVVAPANKVDEVARDVGSTRGGYPLFITSDLRTMARDNETDTPADKVGIKMDQPRIYYGPVIASGPENQDYAIVGGTANGKPMEYDTDGSTYTYTGTGGVSIGNIASRALFATRYQELNMLLSDRIDGNSKILFKRDPRQRVESVAPWLTIDSETYPTVVGGRMKWIVDGYTTLSSLPYAKTIDLEQATKDSLDPDGNTQSLFTNNIAYMRNSVKAVVDAYDGSVELYAFDESDPVLKAWEGVFPGTVKPKSEISEELMAHLRYPADMFKVQRAMIAKYHVSDPQTFFTSDNFWSVPSDPTTDKQSKNPQPPYYIVAADPKTNKAGFQLITPFRGFERDFLSAHMTVTSDPDNFGHITVRILPTETQTIGPSQAQDVMTSSDQVARDQTLWKATNDITNGNLLTLPVGGGEIMYVEPIYTKRKGQESAFPKLLRVLVYYKGNLGYAPTIAEALNQVGIDPRAAADLKEAKKLDGGKLPAPKPANKAEATPGTVDEAAPAQPEKSAAAPGDVNEALNRVNDALKALDAAKEKSHEEYGKALDELDRAVADYQKAFNGSAPEHAAPAVPAEGAAPAAEQQPAS